MWSWLYRTGVKLSERSFHKNTSDLLPFAPKRFRQMVEEYAPDAVVCTHVFASLLIGHLRQSHVVDMPVIGINTDFTLHPFWELVNQDYIVLAGRGMDYSVQKRGVGAGQILPLGLPVDPKFNRIEKKSKSRAMLQLYDMPTLLLMSGSMGYGDMLESVKKLDVLPTEFQMVVICGNNQKLRDAIREEIDSGSLQKHIRVCGFVENVQDYMAAADIICTKPGGLSVSEAMNVQRPIVLTTPIPGLEEINASFLVNNAVAVQASDWYPLDEAVYNLLRNPARQQQIVEAQKEVTPGHAAEHLADFVVELVEKRNQGAL
jgi:UDP-N-acetylglucosamine:LPS N-acetylglucosamine transferase